MRTVEEFAAATLRRYRHGLAPSVVKDISEDIDAGEYEMAAITVVEMAPVTAAEVDELERLARDFTYPVDLNAARSVIAKQRKHLAEQDSTVGEMGSETSR